MSFIFECIVIIYFDILEMAFNVASVKLDPESAPIDLPQSAPSSKPGSPSKNRSPTPERITSGSTIRHRSGRKTKTPVTVKTLEMSLQPLVSKVFNMVQIIVFCSSELSCASYPDFWST